MRWTKKPANVIWYSAVSADSNMAMPPLRNHTARRKFYFIREDLADGKQNKSGSLTKSVIAKVYRTRMKRNLKK